MNLTSRVKELVLSSGLNLVGIATAGPFPDFRWRNSVMREPTLTLADARSLVIAGFFDLRKIKGTPTNGRSAKIARSYAAGHEYNLDHELIPVKELLENHGYKAEISPAQSGPSTIPLKLAAVRAGLGWQGKHSVVITPEFGSWVTFGGLITNAPLTPDDPITSMNCGDCHLCIDHCPTGAIIEPYIVERSVCLDEILNTPGTIPEDIQARIGQQVLSCDTCLEVCPHSAKIMKRTNLTGTNPSHFNLADLIKLDEEQFRNQFGHLNWSIDFPTFRRNMNIALVNHRDRIDSGNGNFRKEKSVD